jgi:DNA replication and repair protein RecF
MAISEMYLETLSLTNFKNYELQTLELSPQLNCFVGENGMGKTNLLDAIHVLCLSKSHFMSSDQNLVRTGEDFFRLQGKFNRQGKSEDIVVKYKLRGKKQIERNKIPYKRISEHVGLLPLVIIAPDDIQLIMQGSEERRRFLDLCLVQLDPEYMQQLMLYNQVLEQRNALLRAADDHHSPDPSLLDIYDAQLLKPAEFIFNKRTELIEKLTTIFQSCYAAISGERETVEMRYTSQLQGADFEMLLLESRRKDIILQRSNKGIHKDDLELEIKGQALKRFASQGQLKSFLMAMKLAQYEFLRQFLNIPPLLLLDDIFDKLDATRVSQLLDLLLKRDFGQIFITDTHEERVATILKTLSLKSNYKKFMIKDAQVISEQSA